MDSLKRRLVDRSLELWRIKDDVSEKLHNNLLHF